MNACVLCLHTTMLPLLCHDCRTPTPRSTTATRQTLEFGHDILIIRTWRRP